MCLARTLGKFCIGVYVSLLLKHLFIILKKLFLGTAMSAMFVSLILEL